MGREPWQQSEDTHREVLSDNPSFPAKVPRGCSIEQEMSSARAANIIGSIPDQPDDADLGWFKFPKHLGQRVWKFEDKSAIFVYIALWTHVVRSHAVWPSQATIQRMTGLSRRSVYNGLQTLEKMGLIRTEWWKARRRNRYVLLPPCHPLERKARCTSGGKHVAQEKNTE